MGAGPVGLVLARALADRGDDIVLLDRDRGPGEDGHWRRKGVMQFEHPHMFRPFVRFVLEEHAPVMWKEVVAAGAVVNPAPDGAPPVFTSISSRRSTFEAALRRGVRHERVLVVDRHADRIVVEGGRVTAVVADGVRYDVDRVLVATGRSSGFADDLRPPGESSPCGFSYVSRMYRARPGVEPLVSWRPLEAQHDGYQTIAFPQDAGTLSALFVRRSGDPGWAPLWHSKCFDAAVAQIPNLQRWTDPERFEPITDVLRGGTLVNAYRAQGAPPAGVFFVGDAVCTTNPAFGRGVTLGLLQAASLLTLLAEHDDPRDVSAAFDAWCEENVRPWYEDHVAVDAATRRAYDGEPLDPEGPITSDVVVAAAGVDPWLMPLVMPYFGMVAPPASLLPAHDRVRALLWSGWRPPVADGPSRDALVADLAALAGGAATTAV